MKVKWAHKAKIDYVDTLSYWKDRNVSTLYPQKIDTAVLKLEKEIAANPYFLAKYNHKLNLYRRSFMRGRYLCNNKILLLKPKQPKPINHHEHP